jgi:hypothetical protein
VEGVQTTFRVSLDGPCWKEFGLPGVFTVEVALLYIQTQGLWPGRLGGMMLEFMHARMGGAGICVRPLALYGW